MKSTPYSLPSISFPKCRRHLSKWLLSLWHSFIYSFVHFLPFICIPSICFFYLSPNNSRVYPAFILHVIHYVIHLIIRLLSSVCLSLFPQVVLSKSLLKRLARLSCHLSSFNSFSQSLFVSVVPWTSAWVWRVRLPRFPHFFHHVIHSHILNLFVVPWPSAWVCSAFAFPASFIMSFILTFICFSCSLTERVSLQRVRFPPPEADGTVDDLKEGDDVEVIYFICALHV